MWKILIAFIVFAAAALFIIMQGGDKVDLSGEKHGAEAVHSPAPTQSTTAPESQKK